MKRKTADNIGFAICGVEGSCVENPVILVAKKVSASIFFCNLVSGKLFLLSAVLVEIFGVKARTSQSRFPLAVIIRKSDGKSTF